MLKKEFYFLRHGETDFNRHPDSTLKEHPRDISLNEKGKAQAAALSTPIQNLSIEQIYLSPLSRVYETYSLLFPQKNKPIRTINEFEECSVSIWNQMMQYHRHKSASVDAFLSKIEIGLNTVFESSANTLIIAHGGTHWALCELLGIEEHERVIDNCQLVHFYHQDRWQAKIINT